MYTAQKPYFPVGAGHSEMIPVQEDTEPEWGDGLKMKTTFQEEAIDSEHECGSETEIC